MIDVRNLRVPNTKLLLLATLFYITMPQPAIESSAYAQASDPSCSDGLVVSCGGQIPSATSSKDDKLNLCTNDQYEDACVEVIESNASPERKAVAYYTRGGLRLAEHKYEDAIADFSKADSLSPDLDGLSRELGRALEGAEQYKEAKKYYNRALTRNPNDVVALYGRGKSNAALADWDSALSDLTMAIGTGKLSPPENTRAARYRDIIQSITNGKSPKLWNARDIITLGGDNELGFYYECDVIEECVVVTSQCQLNDNFSTITFDVASVTTEELANWARRGILNATVTLDSRATQEQQVRQLTFSDMDGDWSYQIQMLATDVDKLISTATIISFSTGIEQSIDLPISEQFLAFVGACKK